MMQKILSWVKPIAGAAILALLFWRLGSVAFLDSLRVLTWPTLAAAAGIGLLTTAFSAWRWCLTARGLGIRLTLRGAIADYYQALFLNATLPGGLLGDVDRAVRNGRDTGDVGRGVRAVVLERTAGQLMLFAVGAVVLAANPGLVLAVSGVVTVSPVVVGVGAAVLTAALAFIVLKVRPARMRQIWNTATADVRQGLLSRRNWPGILLASVVVLGGHIGTFLLAARAAGSHAPTLTLLPLLVMALLVMVLPVSIGGFGPREGFLAWAFTAAGFGATQGLTVAVVYGLFALVASLPGVVVLAVRLVARLRTATVSAAPAAAVTPSPVVAPAVVLAPVVLAGESRARKQLEPAAA
ncbi:lysylphosphatidylglycerol synthase transmembrane domain-containing protein [Catenuloplanes japonicus]|uniref:lysylphosphatidylglycerol synthase transmembrane domain-containing protein n=1 Tax=Catenuloplanes japonicus TaxID=33876 RepID=UPI000524CC6D|nr:lysylphosphatidylglycerol synthase transmembrane domain-containing protein [Catenuloplanes japonicus]